MLETAGLDSAVLDAGIAAQQLQLVNAIVDEDRQYATRLTITRTDNENASESVISTVISWLMKKKGPIERALRFFPRWHLFDT